MWNFRIVSYFINRPLVGSPNLGHKAANGGSMVDQFLKNKFYHHDMISLLSAPLTLIGDDDRIEENCYLHGISISFRSMGHKSEGCWAEGGWTGTRSTLFPSWGATIVFDFSHRPFVHPWRSRKPRMVDRYKMICHDCLFNPSKVDSVQCSNLCSADGCSVS